MANKIDYQTIRKRYAAYLKKYNNPEFDKNNSKALARISCEIFDLNDKYDKESLTKVWRQYLKTLSSKNGMNNPEIQEITKVINAAYSTLVINIRPLPEFDLDDGTQQEDATKVIEQYRKQKIEELRKLLEIPTGYDNIYLDKINKIDEIVNRTSIEFQYNAIDKQEIDEFYEQAIKEIKAVYEEIKQDYYKKYNIIEVLISKERKLNFDVTLSGFIKQLKQIENEFSLSTIIRNNLANESQKYINHLGYPSLAIIINAEIYQISQDCALGNDFYYKTKNEQSNYVTKIINQKISEFNARVKASFKKYSEVKQKIDDLGPEVYSIDDDVLADKYKLLNDQLANITSFETIKKSIEELETLIKQKSLFNVEELTNVVDSIMKKIGLILAGDGLNFTKKTAMAFVLKNLIETYDRWRNEKDSMAIMLVHFLNKVDFEKDFVNANLKYIFVSFSKSHIYLSKTNPEHCEKEGSFYFGEPIDNNILQVYEVQNGKVISTSTITIEELYMYYTPLENVMYSMHLAQNKVSLETDNSADVHFFNKEEGYYFYSYFNSDLAMPLIGVKEGKVLLKQTDENRSRGYLYGEWMEDKDKFIKELIDEIKYIINNYKQNQNYKRGR